MQGLPEDCHLDAAFEGFELPRCRCQYAARQLGAFFLVLVSRSDVGLLCRQQGVTEGSLASDDLHRPRVYRLMGARASSQAGGDVDSASVIVPSA